MAEETSAEKIARLERKIKVLEKEIARLQRLLEEALRAVKRQAAPFSRQNPKAAPEKPGRKPGKKYGRPSRRAVPEQVDEVIEVPLPLAVSAMPGGARGMRDGVPVSNRDPETAGRAH